MSNRIVRNTHDQPTAIFRAAIAMKWFHIFIKKLGIVKGKLFTFFDLAKRHYIQSIISTVRITAMILRGPFGRVTIPNNKNFFTYRIGIATEMLLVIFIPAFHSMTTGNKSLRHFFSVKNYITSGQF